MIAAVVAAGIVLRWCAQTVFAEPFVWLGVEYQLLSPMFLVAGAAIPSLIWVASSSVTDLSRAQRAVGVLVRGCLLVALVVALCRPALTGDSSRVSCAFLIDSSASITDAALTNAYEMASRAWRESGENDVQLISFASNAHSVLIADGETEIAPPSRAERSEEEADTDLASALQLAYGVFPPGYLQRIVLLSDGNQTRGDALAEASRAAEFGVPISFYAPEVDVPDEIAIRSIELPERIAVGQPFEVRVGLFSTLDTSARLRLYQDGMLNGLEGVRDIDISAGNDEIRFNSIVRTAGPVTYRAEVQAGGEDRFSGNNRFEVSTLVPGPPAVLYVEGDRGRERYLTQALTAAQYEVDVRSARSIPTDARELERYDFFILSDVAASEVSSSQQDAIERYVRDSGGGFLMAGGENAFGLGGWQGSRVERMLPVRMDSERRRDQPSLGLALVIDKSGSMNGPKIELAKEAAKATAELLGSDDYIEVIGFDSAPQAIVRMQSARNRVRILRDIGRLQARGGNEHLSPHSISRTKTWR